MIKLQGGYRKAIKISAWLKENGFEHERDYNWHCISDTGECVFTFTDEQNESLVAMRWALPWAE